MRRFAAPLLLAALVGLSATGAARPAEPEVRLDLPRDHGWWIGDVLAMAAEITVDADLVLDPASLPRPRTVDYWLELRAADLLDGGVRDGRRTYRLSLEYQTFYAPLEPKAMTVPPVVLAFRAGGDPVTVTVPPWRFVTAPVREILAPTSPAALRDPRAPQVVDTLPAQVRAGSALAVTALAGGLFAWHRNLPPFRRRDRPFADAARALRRTRKAPDGPDRRRAALIVLHRAFDRAFGRRMGAADVAAFVTAKPAFMPLGERIAAFFEASRAVFFAATPTDGATSEDDLRAFAEALAAVERRRP
ncbi:hypothetical protein [Mongoliimonas terrestris]|uniref:hypothetical protein n=1 Tax=Mongoliimonas terrestris TaxID=1709001 RepID=UPI000949885D|nr:hypothetical protein [Mongoliimonas terrestris]